MKINLGNRLKELRKEKGLTQSEIAKIFNISPVAYLHYEKNQRQPPLELLADFANYFNVTTDYLLGISNY